MSGVRMDLHDVRALDWLIPEMTLSYSPTCALN